MPAWIASARRIKEHLPCMITWEPLYAKICIVLSIIALLTLSEFFSQMIKFFIRFKNRTILCGVVRQWICKIRHTYISKQALLFICLSWKMGKSPCKHPAPAHPFTPLESQHKELALETEYCTCIMLALAWLDLLLHVNGSSWKIFVQWNLLYWSYKVCSALRSIFLADRHMKESLHVLWNSEKHHWMEVERNNLLGLVLTL